jgi:hypothetical protein
MGAVSTRTANGFLNHPATQWLPGEKQVSSAELLRMMKAGLAEVVGEYDTHAGQYLYVAHLPGGRVKRCRGAVKTLKRKGLVVFEQRGSYTNLVHVSREAA